jgi:hypothetical protein
VFKFFLLRLLEDLMSIDRPLHLSHQSLPSTHLYSNLLTEVDPRPQLLVHASPDF